MNLFRQLGRAILVLLPWALRRRLLVWCFGYRLDPSSRIGFSWVFPDHLEMGPGAWIGHLNMVKGMATMRMAAGSNIGKLNWITGEPKRGGRHFSDEPDRHPALLMDEGASITGRHFIDCSNTLSIGAFTIVAGNRSQIYTHAVDLEHSRQASQPVTIGHHCFIGAGAVILPGAKVPDCSVVGAMSLARGDLGEPYGLYAGVPARLVKRFDPEKTKFFSRTRSWVD